MNKPLLGSIVLATLLLGDASASTIYERFEAMEKEMKGLQNEVTDLKAKQLEAEEAAAEAEEEEPEEDEDSDSDEDGDDEDDGEEEEDINEIIEEMQEEITDLTKATSGNHIKLSLDFRTSYDNVRYKMAGTGVVRYSAPNPNTGLASPVIDYAVGRPVIDQVSKNQKNNSLFSNRLWLNMNWAANKNISFTGQLAYNKTYGGRFNNTGMGSGFEDFDWFVNENANGDGNVRVKSAYWFYRNTTFLGTDIPWTFSLGRRPSTNGHLINLRDDDPAASPSGHSINVEFDGLSSKFSFEKLTGIEGMYVKLCAGQGATSASEKFSAAPYSNNTGNTGVDDVILAGLIFVPYDDGQYAIGTQFYGATNLPGQNVDFNPTSPTRGSITGLTQAGDLYSGSVYFMMNGIGDELSDFLDDTTFFVSGSMSRTNPDNRLDNFGQQQAMLGSTDMQNGYSYWVGLNMPSLISEDGRFGLEFNHGSKYWRPITYGEDTMIGSKVAARGNAYEMYFTEPLVDDVLSLQIRYTYIDYDYSGSNGFFGNASGTPYSIDDLQSNPFLSGVAGNVVDVAQDLRIYLRYRY
ncbi:DUF3373 family protein [Sulfurimonas sp. MAG313]|nr:DUF3373 family protein [Sulfurimonas sp. MAG313]MDF1882136.1 DUF3373 family protein [Sulfurimonas sp. MAG313]